MKREEAWQGEKRELSGRRWIDKQRKNKKRVEEELIEEQIKERNKKN